MRPRPLRQYRVLFELVPEGKQAIDRKMLGERSKLGGTPDWEQVDETPACPICGRSMQFVGQLDSIEHDRKTNPSRMDALSENQQYMFGDVGMIYIFFCFECLEVHAVFQCG